MLHGGWRAPETSDGAVAEGGGFGLITQRELPPRQDLFMHACRKDTVLAGGYVQYKIQQSQVGLYPMEYQTRRG